MKTFLKKAPTLIVIGVTGFVTYTILFPDGDSGSPKGEAKPPSSDNFTTGVASNTLRNPFLMDQPAGPTSPSVATGGSIPERGPAEVASTDAPDELLALPSEEDRTLETMSLAGTFIDGREQFAIIGNKVYARGDRLRGLDGATLPYTVVEVRKDCALVRRGRRDFVIAFSDVPRAAAARTAVAPPKPGEERAATKAETLAKFTPIAKSRKGPPTSNGKTDGVDSNDQRDMLLQLLSTFGGGGGSSGSNPLAGAGPGAGASSSVLNTLINPTTLGAGLDAIMGKGDNIGQGGGTGP